MMEGILTIVFIPQGCELELLIGTRESKDSRVQAGLASPRSSIGLARPRVPASPRAASPRVQKVGLVPALV